MTKKSPVKNARDVTVPYPSHPLTVSRAEAAATLGVNIQTVDGWIIAKALRASKPDGRRVLIRVADIEAMLDGAVVQ